MEKATQFTGLLICSSVSSHWVSHCLCPPTLKVQGTLTQGQVNLVEDCTKGAGDCLGSVLWLEQAVTRPQYAIGLRSTLWRTF